MKNQSKRNYGLTDQEAAWLRDRPPVYELTMQEVVYTQRLIAKQLDNMYKGVNQDAYSDDD